MSKAKAAAVEAKVEETVVETPAAEKPKKAPEPVMYVGPTIPRIGIQNRVYTEIPAGAQEAIKETPVLRNLFIQIREYPEAERQLRVGKGYINSAFNKALQLKGGNES